MSLSPTLAPPTTSTGRWAKLWRGSNARGFSWPVSLLLLTPVLALMAPFFLLPIIGLLKESVFAPEFTLRSYARVIEESLYVRVMLRTLWISFLVSIATLLLGYPVAMLMARVKGLWAVAVAACVLVPLWTSVLIRSYAWIVLLQRNGIVNDWLQALGIIESPLKMLYTEGAVMMAMTHVLLPFVILPIYGALKSIPADLTLAARNLGAGRWRSFWLVTLPLSLPGIYAGVLMTFILAIGFYVTPALIGGPQTLFIATLIGQQTTQVLDWSFAGALSAVLLVITLIIVTLFGRFLGLDRKVS
jgi:mannopine transport system permease protein